MSLVTGRRLTRSAGRAAQFTGRFDLFLSANVGFRKRQPLPATIDLAFVPFGDSLVHYLTPAK